MKSVIFFKCLNYTFVALAQRQLLRVTKNKNYSLSTIMGKSVDTFKQNKRFLSTSFRNFKKTSFLSIANSPPPLPLFNVAIRSVDTITWLQH